MMVKARGGEKKAIDTHEKAEVKFFRVKVGAAFDLPPEQLCLIYAGKILKDHETLNTHGINDDKTVHLVIKTGQGSNRAAAEPSQPRTNPSQVRSIRNPPSMCPSSFQLAIFAFHSSVRGILKFFS